VPWHRPKGAASIQTKMSLNRGIRIVITILLFAGALWAATNRQFYIEALRSSFFALALTSVIIIHFRVRPSWQDAVAVASVALVVSFIDYRVLQFKPFFMAWFSFAGLSSLLVLGIRAVWSQDADRKLLFLAFIPSLLFVVSEYFADTFLKWTSHIHPKALDLYLLSFDASLHVQLPFLVGQAFQTWNTLRVVSLLFYLALPIPIAVVYAGRVLRFREKAVPSMAAFLITGPLGILFYNLFPALGPAHLLGPNFPWNPIPFERVSHLLAEPIALVGPRNAIPSLHMAWVVLVCWYSRNLSWWERAIAFVFLVFTVLATLGTGEHYFIDLVVAFPFALLVESICAFSLPLTNTNRMLTFGLGLLLTLAWLWMLRVGLHFFWATPVLPWSFCGATVALSLIFERQLHRPEPGGAWLARQGTAYAEPLPSK
jgi:hypothetical protein